MINILNCNSSKLYIFTNGYNPKPLLEDLEGRKNIRVIISFISGQTTSQFHVKLETITKLITRSIPTYVNLVIDVEGNNIEYFPDEVLTKIFGLVKRAYLNKKLKGKCDLNTENLKRLWGYAENISSKYKIVVFAPSQPNTMQYLILNAISKLIYRQPISICSGYPLKAFYSETGDLTNCPYFRSIQENIR